MLLSKWLLSITDDLILEVIKGQRVTHGELGLCLVGPLRLESDGEVTYAVSLHWEGRGVGGVDGEVVSIFGGIWLPSNLDIPISLGVVDYGQVLGDLASGRDVHLEDGLEGLGLDGEDDSVPPHVCLGFVGDQHVG